MAAVLAPCRRWCWKPSGRGAWRCWYGSVLTAWSAAGIAGPQLVAFLKDNYAEHLAGCAFTINAGVLAAGMLLSLMLSDVGAGHFSDQ